MQSVLARRLANLPSHVGPVGHWTLDVRTMRRTWSREIFELLELPVKQEPPAMDAVLQIYTPSQRAHIYAAIGAAITSHQPWNHTLRMVTATGRIFTATSIGHPVFDAEGRCTHYQGSFHELIALERKIAV